MTRVLVEDLPALPPDLAALAGVAAGGDALVNAGAEQLAPGQEPPPVVDRGAEFAGMLTIVVRVLNPVLPFLEQCYPPSTCEQIGGAFAAVADKYGWEFEALNSPELALAVVTIPPTIQAVMMGRAHFAAQREAAERAENSTAAPGAPPRIAAPVPAPAPGPTYSPAHDGAR